MGTTEADVTEGSGGVWERLHYDWSDPNRVVMTTTDSNVWGGDSSHTYTFTRNADRDDRHQLRRHTRGQEPQGTAPRARAPHRRQEPPGDRVPEQHQGDRGKELPDGDDRLTHTGHADRVLTPRRA